MRPEGANGFFSVGSEYMEFEVLVLGIFFIAVGEGVFHFLNSSISWVIPFRHSLRMASSTEVMDKEVSLRFLNHKV